MAYQPFYLNPAGSALNPGGTTSTTPTYSTTNGNWNSGTGIFTPTDGSTPATYVNVGDYAALYNDGASGSTFWGQVSAVAGGVNGAITIHATRRAGSPPSTSATARSLRVGGAAKGPSGGTSWPFNSTDLSTLKDSSGNIPKFWATGTFSVTATLNMSAANKGDWELEGYSSTPGDGGFATIDGGTSGASYSVMTIPSLNGISLRNITVKNNGATGSASLITNGASNSFFTRFVSGPSRGNGMENTASGNQYREVEVYGANTSNTSGKAGFTLGGGSNLMDRVDIHDNTGSNTSGCLKSAGTGDTWIESRIVKSGAENLKITAANLGMSFQGLDLYLPGTHNINITAANCTLGFENCNVVKAAAGQWGITSGSNTVRAYMRKCGFGGGTYANGYGAGGGGDVNFPAGSLFANEEAVAYATHPWVDPDTGNYRLTSPLSVGQGRRTWTQTASGWTGSTSTTDIGGVKRTPIAVSVTGGKSIVSARCSSMDVPLDEVVYPSDLTCSDPVTGADAAATGTPTFAVYEESTGTDIGVGGNMTARGALTGQYYCSFTASAANGFELGKWYNVKGTATVGGVTKTETLLHFRIVAAEATAGYPKTNVAEVQGSSSAADRLKRGLRAVGYGTVAASSTTTLVKTSALAPAAAVADQFINAFVVFDEDTTTANLRGQRRQITASNTSGELTVNALTTAPASGDTFIIA